MWFYIDPHIFDYIYHIHFFLFQTKSKIMKNKDELIFKIPPSISRLYDLKGRQEFEMKYNEKNGKYLFINIMTKLEEANNDDKL